MLKEIKYTALLLVFVLVGACFYLWTPGPAAFDKKAAIAAAQNYNARVIRDAFGVPHIYGARDADVAFGLAYAHAEDDWATIEEVIFFSRGELARHKGKSAAIPDYLMGALHVTRDVREKYEQDLAPKTKALVEAYAAGVNLWCVENPKQCSPGVAPVTKYDVIAGFVSRTPFFYGLDQHLTKIFEGDVKTVKAADNAREALFKVAPDHEIGSNAMAVAPHRSADGHTRLMVNSHQPYVGPVAWYEARVKSEEGWDMIGALFPGAPVVLVGTGPELGWAMTVNKPDLVDVFQMTVDDLKKPTQYMFDGAWREFDVTTVDFRVKLFGPFSLPVKRRALDSVHGPVFVTDNGVYGVSYAGAGDIRSAEQWYRMNKAQDYSAWRSAMDMSAIPSFNVVYADAKGNIGYYYNAAIPVREEGVDWSKAQAGNTSALVWSGQHPFAKVPMVENPSSGYVVNANHPPFQASSAADNPLPADFPPHMGIDRRETNRGLRIQALYGGDTAITGEEFQRYKMDHHYAVDSRMMELVRDLVANAEAQADSALNDALDTLRAWDGSVTVDNRSAALAVLTAQKARGALLNDENADSPNYLHALRETEQALRAGFGRVDPTWGEVVRLKRGDLSLAIAGGPDTLRAVYPAGDPAKGSLAAAGGDTYILYADWDESGEQSISTIHQYGAATLNKNSPHYSDQAQIFANEEWKEPPMGLDALLAQATADYRPGKDAAR